MMRLVLHISMLKNRYYGSLNNFHPHVQQTYLGNKIADTIYPLSYVSSTKGDPSYQISNAVK